MHASTCLSVRVCLPLSPSLYISVCMYVCMYIIYNLQKIYSSALTCAAIKVLNMPLRQVSHRARTHLCLVYVYLRVCAQAKDSRPKPFACSTIPGKKSFPRSKSHTGRAGNMPGTAIWPAERWCSLSRARVVRGHAGTSARELSSR